MNNERGVALGIILIMFFVFATAAFAVMAMGLNRMSTSRQTRDRMEARYVAEAGLVWAMQRLWVNPTYCGVPDPPLLGGLAVDVTVTNCVAGVPHVIEATVAY